MHFTRSVILSAVVSGAVQLASALSISSQCQSTLLGVASSTDGQCINAAGLSGLFLQSSGSSVISPVDTWLQGLCSIGTCSNTALANIVSNLTSGCGTELASVINGASASQLTTLVQTGYPTVRQIGCLKQSSTLCVTQTLTNVQSTVGTLTLTELSTLLSNSSSVLASLPASTICTDCNKASFNLAEANFPTLVAADNASLALTCGSSFINGTAPSGISESAVNGTYSSTSKSGAVPTISGVQAMLLSSLVGSALLVIVA